MKRFLREFVKRGCLFAWGGPVVVCIVWACLKGAGAAQTIDLGAAVLAVLSTLALAFVVAGISVVNQMEQLPKAMAALIQMGVLYGAYLSAYLINGWLPTRAIGIFTLIFLAGFALIWAGIYLAVRHSVKKLNAQLGN